MIAEDPRCCRFEARERRARAHAASVHLQRGHRQLHHASKKDETIPSNARPALHGLPRKNSMAGMVGIAHALHHLNHSNGHVIEISIVSNSESIAYL
jgi:hypothetical protein